MIPLEFSHLCKMLFCSANLLVLGVESTHGEKIASLYSRLNGASCSLESVEKKTGTSITQCEGVGGIQLIVQHDDERASISVVDLHKKVHPLNYWDIVTPAMFSLDKVAEWRVAKRGKRNVPVALIVGIKSFDQSDLEHPRKLPLVVIAKITDRDICVISVIPRFGSTSERVRQEADHSADKPCLSAP
jgi:hypothetical protein